MGLWALGLIESLDNCKYSFFLGAVGPAWHGHSYKAAHPQNPIYSSVLFMDSLGVFILKLENKDNFFKCSWEMTFPEWKKNIRLIFVKFIHRMLTECPIPSLITRDRDARILLGSEMGCPPWQDSQLCTHVKGGF